MDLNRRSEFGRIIDDLVQVGLTVTEIADAVGVTQANLSRMRYHDHEPLYYLGAKLKKLHALEMRRHKRRLDAPALRVKT